MFGKKRLRKRVISTLVGLTMMAGASSAQANLAVDLSTKRMFTLSKAPVYVEMLKSMSPEQKLDPQHISGILNDIFKKIFVMICI